MVFNNRPNSTPPASTGDMIYEPPQVEVVVSVDDLEREVLYAGFPSYGIT